MGNEIGLRPFLLTRNETWPGNPKSTGDVVYNSRLGLLPTEKARNVMKQILSQANHGNQQLRVCETEFKGHQLIDIRYWYCDVTGEWKPSTKGLSISPMHLNTILQGLEKAKEIA